MHRPALAAVSSLALLALAACSQDGPRAHPLHGGDPPPRTEPAPADALPPGHPPMDGPPQKAGPLPGKTPAPAPAPTSGALTWTAPDGWKESAASGMRMAQFDLPGTWEGGASVQCVVFTAMGGGKQGNLDRWVGQVAGVKDTPKITETKQEGITVTRIEMRGSFTDGMAKRTAEDALFLGAVVEVPGVEGVYTVKLAGPRSVIEPEMAKFDALLASLKTK